MKYRVAFFTLVFFLMSSLAFAGDHQKKTSKIYRVTLTAEQTKQIAGIALDTFPAFLLEKPEKDNESWNKIEATMVRLSVNEEGMILLDVHVEKAPGKRASLVFDIGGDTHPIYFGPTSDADPYAITTQGTIIRDTSDTPWKTYDEEAYSRLNHWYQKKVQAQGAFRRAILPTIRCGLSFLATGPLGAMYCAGSEGVAAVQRKLVNQPFQREFTKQFSLLDLKVTRVEQETDTNTLAITDLLGKFKAQQEQIERLQRATTEQRQNSTPKLDAWLLKKDNQQTTMGAGTLVSTP